MEPVIFLQKTNVPEDQSERLGSTLQENTVLPRAQRGKTLQRESTSVYSARYGLVCAIQLLPEAEAREHKPEGKITGKKCQDVIQGRT